MQGAALVNVMTLVVGFPTTVRLVSADLICTAPVTTLVVPSSIPVTPPVVPVALIVTAPIPVVGEIVTPVPGMIWLTKFPPTTFTGRGNATLGAYWFCDSTQILRGYWEVDMKEKKI